MESDPLPLAQDQGLQEVETLQRRSGPGACTRLKQALEELVGATDQLLSWLEDGVAVMNPGYNPGFTAYQPCHPGQAVNSLSLSFINHRMGIITRFMS